MINKDRIRKGAATTPDPYNILSLVQYYYPKSSALTYKKKETIIVVPSDLSKSNTIYKKIESELKRKFTSVEFSSRKDGEWYKIRVSKGGRGSVHILTTKGKISEVMRPGMAYELYFQSVLLDGITFTKNRRKLLSEDISDSILNTIPSMNLSLVVSAGRKKVGIGNIKSSSRVGGENLKPDVIIYRNGGSPVRISLKQSNFFHWGGADTLSRFSKRARSILDNAVKSGIISLGDGNTVIFPPGVDGIRVPATREEVKYYIFGESSNTVEYVMINARLSYHDDMENVIYMNADQVYKKDSNADVSELMNDVFLIIRKTGKTSGPTALAPYKGVSASFKNRNHAYNALDGSNYIDI